METTPVIAFSILIYIFRLDQVIKNITKEALYIHRKLFLCIKENPDLDKTPLLVHPIPTSALSQGTAGHLPASQSCVTSGRFLGI